MRVVVVGAGFGGLETVTRLEERLRARRDVTLTLVSDQNYLLFTPLLPQIVSCYIEPRHIIQTVRDVRRKRRFEFRREEVAAVDLPAGSFDFIPAANWNTTTWSWRPAASPTTLGFPGPPKTVFP